MCFVARSVTERAAPCPTYPRAGRCTAAALVLLEHRWAIGLRDAVARAGGFRISEGFISPLDLVAVGLVAADEAAAMMEGD